MKRILLIALFIILGGYAAYSFYGDFLNKEHSVIVIDSEAVVQEVQLLGRLELVKYKIKDVFRSTTTDSVGRKYWFGKMEVRSEIMLVVAGEAIGCIDLAKLTVQDIRIDADTVYVRVPEPEVCVFKIDHQNTEVMNTKFDSWDWRKDKEANQIATALKEAEKAVEQNALNLGILTETRNQAGPFLTALFEKFGFAKVVLESQATETGPVTAPTTQ